MLKAICLGRNVNTEVKYVSGLAVLAAYVCVLGLRHNQTSMWFNAHKRFEKDDAMRFAAPVLRITTKFQFWSSEWKAEHLTLATKCCW